MKTIKEEEQENDVDDDDEEVVFMGSASSSSSSSSSMARPIERIHEMGLPPFLTKTFEMVEDPSTDAIVSWNEARNSFIFWDSYRLASNLLPKGGVEELAAEVGGAWVGFGEPDLGFNVEVRAPGGVVGEEATAEADEDEGVEGVDGVGRGLEAHLGVGEVEDEVLPLVADVVALGGREAVCREAAVLRRREAV
ncbi:hypothetical protein Syun_012240 [Stephania yunnanensis]|uniref:HSF-type DNA-binding domain-containing protein n=1 Tax=Stephania yunnanensis TaxID=152371 RepID=A0AAP0PIU4_9MAGN